MTSLTHLPCDVTNHDRWHGVERIPDTACNLLANGTIYRPAGRGEGTGGGEGRMGGWGEGTRGGEGRMGGEDGGEGRGGGGEGEKRGGGG